MKLQNNNTFEKPLVSIIVASYNYENLIKRTLDSLLAQTYKNIEIIVAISFVGHDSKWPEQSQKRLKSLIQKATNCIVVSQEANTASYKKRNCYMVDHADFLVGVFDNAKQMRSGTAQTVNYALRQGKQIILIHPDTADTAYLR